MVKINDLIRQRSDGLCIISFQLNPGRFYSAEEGVTLLKGLNVQYSQWIDFGAMGLCSGFSQLRECHRTEGVNVNGKEEFLQIHRKGDTLSTKKGATVLNGIAWQQPE